MASLCFVVVVLSLRTVSGKQSERAVPPPMRESAQRTATVIVNAMGETSVAVQEQQDYDDYYAYGLSSTDYYYYGLGSSDEYDYYYYGLGNWVGDKARDIEHGAEKVGKDIEHGAEKVGKGLEHDADQVGKAIMSSGIVKDIESKLCNVVLGSVGKKEVGTIVKKALGYVGEKAAGAIVNDSSIVTNSTVTCSASDVDADALCAAANKKAEILGFACVGVVNTLWPPLCKKIVAKGTEYIEKALDGALTSAKVCDSVETSV